jgi:Fe-S-cluster containining protein
MRLSGFVCKQCGNCCINLYDAYQHSASQEDIDMWRDNGRDDILAWVDPIELGNGVYVYDLWIKPKTGGDVARCPWLRKLPGKDKYICKIHDVKPRVCREYPKFQSHATKTGCKGFVK